MPFPPTRSGEIVDLSTQLKLSITRIARQLRQSSDVDLTPTQISVLATVAGHGPLTLGELAERERVAAPTITRVTGVLHDRGLLSRVPDPEDRRYVRVEITRDGEDVLSRTGRRRTAWLTRRLQTLDADELERLAAAAEVLDRIAEGEADT